MSAEFFSDAFADWIGRSEWREEVIAAQPLIGLAACLDRDDKAPEAGDAVPPGWHWLYFLPAYKTAEGGYDGHAKLGGFLPPVPLPRRMWAGGRLAFHQPLLVGERARKLSSITAVTVKQGRSGALVFVTVRHEISGSRGLAMVEEHDIVYREKAAGRSQPPAAPADALFTRQIQPGPLLLFRYSALTYNGHRIHYDRDFCRDEGYPGLVVHGPLIATLMLDLVRDNEPSRPIGAFRFRAVSPLFDTAPFTVNAKTADDGVAVWTAGAAGALAMTGQVQFSG